MTPLRPSAWCLSLLLFAACGGAAAGGEVHFGMAAPMEQEFGISNRQGAELARDEINKAGGIDGRVLVLDFQDDQASGSKAAAVAQGYVDDPNVVAVVGHANSGSMVAAARIYDGRLAAVATSATSPALSGISSWTFRVVSSDAKNGGDLARFADRLGKKRVAVLYESNAYGRGLAQNFIASFSGEVIANDPISETMSPMEAALYVDWFVARAPDLIFVAGTEVSGATILQAASAKKLGIDFLGGDGWALVARDPVLSEGSFLGTPFTSSDPDGRVQSFRTAFRAKFNAEPFANSALAYDATYLLAAAVREVGTDRLKVRDWLVARTQERPFVGVTGPIAFDSLGDPIGKAFKMVRISAGQLTMAENSR